MTNTPTREHREAAAVARAGGTIELLIYERRFIEGEPQRRLGTLGTRLAELERIAQAICDTDQRGYERGREAERAEVARYLSATMTSLPRESVLAAIESGKHLAKEE